MSFDPARGRAALRRGRVSRPGAQYFLTVCTAGKASGLTQPDAARGVLGELQALAGDGSWVIRCATVMPDHFHALITLGARLSLGRAVQRLKAKTSPALRRLGLSWERDFFDHQLRRDEGVDALFLYIYLNPYRAGLRPVSETWPWYYCRPEDWLWFQARTDSNLPPPEWLAR